MTAYRRHNGALMEIARIVIARPALEQKIALRHRQHVGRRTGEKFAVSAHLVGLGIDFDVRRGFLEIPSRVFCTATSAFCVPSFLPRPALTAAADAKTTDEAVRARPNAPNMGR
jgi:hypothetical protein